MLVSEGIGKAGIWEGLAAQSLLGLEGFVETLKDHVTGKRKVGEIPKEQRLIGRASLGELFGESADKAKRNRLIAAAVYRYGYGQMEVAHHLRLHYSTVSWLIKSNEQR